MKYLLELIEDDIKFINFHYCGYVENTSTMCMDTDIKELYGTDIRKITQEILDTVFDYTLSKFDDLPINNQRGAWLNSFTSWVETQITGEKVFLITSSLSRLHYRYTNL